ncbi:hypothetical protein LDK25_08990 [Fusobacterium nucleatum]|mgnify:CR=1 FL=1|uniref:hypothetical protein n=1 Tax=Fusobacterium nucleatum TaxID=851 RepID=UPI0030EE6820
MKKLFRLLLVFSIMFMVACGSSYEKNPYVTKEQFTSDEIIEATKDMLNATVETYDSSGNTSKRKFENFEYDILNSVLSTKYKDVSLRSLVIGVTKTIGDTYDVVLTKLQYDIAYMVFMWNDGAVTLTVPLRINNKEYAVLEIPDHTAQNIQRISRNKDLSQQEKDDVKKREYDYAWTPVLNMYGTVMDIADMKNDKNDSETYLTTSKKTDNTPTTEVSSNVTATKDIFEFVEGKYEISEYASIEFIKEIMKANDGYMLPFAHMAAPSIESVSDDIYFKLGADKAIIDAAAGNMIGAYLSVTYYKRNKQLAVLYFMLDEELIGTQDVRLEFSNGKELDSWDVIRYAQE